MSKRVVISWFQPNATTLALTPFEQEKLRKCQRQGRMDKFAEFIYDRAREHTTFDIDQITEL